MSASCHRRRTCRICGETNLTQVLSFGATPLANAFLTRDALDAGEEWFPLDVFLCCDCGLLQLLDVVDPALLFRNYLYVSSTSPSFVKHFEDYAAAVIEQWDVPATSLVVEIGSNDGILLRPFRSRGMRVLGVDPAEAIAAAATAAGLETWPRFFDHKVAREIRHQHGPARVIAANNVFAHADDLHGILDGVNELLHPAGVFVFEVSYVLDVVEKTLFDMTYHEHLCYHAVRPLEHLFESHGLQMLDAQRVPTHGGSLRGVVQRQGGVHGRRPSVEHLRRLEVVAELDKPATYVAFGKRVDTLRDRLQRLVRELKGQDKRIIGFGAPAKLTTLMHYFQIGPNVVDFIVDDSPLKQQRFTPGFHIPILAVEEMYRAKPDYVLILAWNFAEAILKKHQAFRQAGGRFIVPLPELVVS